MEQWFSGYPGDFRCYLDLMKLLVLRDLKLKYRRSFLGYVWSVLNPLLIMLVMTFVFSTMFRDNIENFPVYLFSGQLLFNFFSAGTGQAITALTDSAALLKKASLPQYIFPVARIFSCLLDFLFSLGALALVMAATGARLSLWVLTAPFVILQLTLFSLGLGLFLAQANVFFRDIRYIYNALTLAWMYMTPIFYPLEQLPPGFQTWIRVGNPLYFYVSQFRAAVYEGCAPEPLAVVSGWIAALLALGLGIWSFRKWKDAFILYL